MVGVAMASAGVTGRGAGDTKAETAAQVTAAFRAAARAKRGQHQKPVDVLSRVFAGSGPGDGRVSPEDFRVAASKLGLDIPNKDILAVFETSEHVMRDGVGKENVVTDGGDDEKLDGNENEDDDESTTSKSSIRSSKALLLYQPWIECTLGIPSRREKKQNGPTAVPFKQPPSERTRVGPLFEHDPSPAADEIFNYPQCRTPVFPPKGWSRKHQIRGQSLPDKTLDLEHVHGCGPGLADRNSLIPIVCVPQRVPEKPPKRGKAMDERAEALENKMHEECVFYAAGVGVVQTIKVDEFEVVDDESDDEDETYKKQKKTNQQDESERRSQRHFRGHDDDIRCLAVHELTRIAASGEAGLEPLCHVWSIDARSGEPPFAVLRHARGLRAVIGCAFDARGGRLATVCGDDGHTVTLWNWNSGGHCGLDFKGGPRVGRMLWSSRSYQTAPPAVRGIHFTPVMTDPDLMVTYGTTHVRFWQPYPDGEEDTIDEKQALALTPTENPTGERKPWRQRAGKNLRVEDVCCGVFLDWCSAVNNDALRARSEGIHSIPHLQHIPAAEEGLQRGVHFVSGSPTGKLLFWENGDGSVPAREVLGSRHRGAVQALTLSSDNKVAGSPRLLLSGDASGAVMCWAVDPLSGLVAAPLGGVFLLETPPKLIEAPPPEREDSIAASELWLESDLENEPLDDGDGDPLPLWNESYPDVRGLAWSPSGKYYLATTSGGSVWRVDLEREPEEYDSDADSDVVTETGFGVDDDDETSDTEADKLNRPRTKVIIRGHDSAVMCVSWSGGGRGARMGIRSVYATGSQNGRITVWNAKTKTGTFAFDAGGPVRSMSFSPDGNHLACGVDCGRIHVFSLSEDPTLALPNNIQPRFHASVISELKTNVTAVSYSPDGALLAAGDGVGNLELFKTTPGGPKNRTYRRRAKCAGHASGVLHIDWSECNTIVRSSSTSYEVLCHAAPSGSRITKEPRFSVDVRETVTNKGTGNELGGWHTWSTPLGFELMGIWAEGMDGTDINGVWRLGNGKYVVSCDDSGRLRVLNFPCAGYRAPSIGNKAHTAHVSAAVGSWCDTMVTSVGARDCAVMQWKVVNARGGQAGSSAKLNGLFELGGLGNGSSNDVEGFDRSLLEEGIVNIKTLDAETAERALAGKVQIEQSDDDDESSDDGDDGIWNTERNRDVAEVDDVFDDMFNDIDYVVPEQGVNKQVRTAHFALAMQQPGAPKSKLWATREEVAERRRVLEHELRKLGRSRNANDLSSTKAADRTEWAPAASVGDAVIPPVPLEKKKPKMASAGAQTEGGE